MRDLKTAILSSLETYLKFRYGVTPSIIDEGGSFDRDTQTRVFLIDFDEKASVKKILKSCLQDFKSVLEIIVRKTLEAHPRFAIDSDFDNQYREILQHVKANLDQKNDRIPTISQLYNIARKYPDILKRKNSIEVYIDIDFTSISNLPYEILISVEGKSYLEPEHYILYYLIPFEKRPLAKVDIDIIAHVVFNPKADRNIKLEKSSTHGLRDYVEIDFSNLKLFIENWYNALLPFADPSEEEWKLRSLAKNSSSTAYKQLTFVMKHYRPGDEEIKRIFNMFTEMGRALNLPELEHGNLYDWFLRFVEVNKK